MISGIQSMNATSYSQYIQGGSKIYVPVRPDQVIYSQFDHVSGYAQIGNKDAGIPVTKIKMLNTLIEQLVNTQVNKIQPELPTEMSEEQVDALISEYQGKLEIAMNSAKGSPFAYDGLSGISTGIIASVSM